MNDIKTIIEQSLIDLYKNDSFLINHLCKEETINHRLAIYLENNFTKNTTNKIYHVDLEYNNNKQNFINSTNELKNTSNVTIHERGSNNHNFLYISTKKNYKNSNDLEEFQVILNQLKKPFNYSYGCLIEYLPKDDFFTLVIVKKTKAKHETELFFVKKPTVEIESVKLPFYSTKPQRF